MHSVLGARTLGWLAMVKGCESEDTPNNLYFGNLKYSLTMMLSP